MHGGLILDESSGSSPRLRGTAQIHRGPGGTAPVHPRACGEQMPLRARPVSAFGSSPRLRGTGLIALRPVVPARFIPAPAGNRALARFENRPMRFIPAPAGNSWFILERPRLDTVHPRACGEQSPAAALDSRKTGSSPRLRGTGVSGGGDSGGKRFIPAPAGNSRLPGLSRSLQPVHPRACGEQKGNGRVRRREDGSSPRLRGTDQLPNPPPAFFRFIPAPAGNSLIASPAVRPTSVHPRACGEQDRLHVCSGDPCGSSPRLRGTAGYQETALRCLRFIPAPAGNSHSHQERL